MPKPDFRRLEEIFHQATALDPGQRPAFLQEACAGDADLLAALQELLKHDQAGVASDTFLQSPLASQAQRLRPLAKTQPDVMQIETESTPAALPLIAGYDVLQLIGRGGMGIVYKARHIDLNRIVALKMLLPNVPVQAEHLARFRTEAEALARLHHPNIITIYEIAEAEGRPYFTMEYISGPSLAKVLNGRPQEAFAAARLLEVIARAVHAIHECGFLHRDLKPENVLLWYDKKPEKVVVESAPPGSFLMEASPKITDFGLAKDLTDVGTLTSMGVTMGTPSYMAPEQARGSRQIGCGVDIYALGTILYEMLTGRPPFNAGNLAETLEQLLNDEPISPRQLRPNLPRDLETICLKCLEKSPQGRYATALEVAEDLRRFQAHEPIHARPVSPLERVYRWCRRRPVVAGLTALSVFLALAFVGTVIGYEIRLNAVLKKEVAREAGQITEQKQRISELHVQIGIASMEDGDAFTAVFHFTEALKVDEGTERERLHRTRIAMALRLSPRLTNVIALDGRVLCGGNNSAVTWSEDHTLDVKGIQDGRSIFSVKSPADSPIQCTLSPDEKLFGLVDSDGTARIWDLSKNEWHALESSKSSKVQRLTFHPAGQAVLVQRENDQPERWDLTTWMRLPWSSLSQQAIASILTNDGRCLIRCSGDHETQVLDTATGKPMGALLHLGQGVKTADVEVSRHLLAVVSPEDELSIWDMSSGGRLGKTIKLDHDVNRIALSPDGARMVVLCRDGKLQFRQIQGGEILAESAAPFGPNTSIVFGGDGRHVLINGDVGEARVWNSSTGQPTTPVLHHGGRLASAQFRSNGQELVTISRSGLACFWELPSSPVCQRGEPLQVRTEGKEQLITLASGITLRASGAADGALRPAHGETRTADAIVNPIGDRIAFCEDAKTVLIANTVDGRTSAPALRHRSPVLYAAFSSNGRLLLTACADRSVRLWDVATGELLSPPLAHSLAIERVCFQEGDRCACVVHDLERESVWDLAEDTHPIRYLDVMAKILAGTPSDRTKLSPPLNPKSMRELWGQLSSSP
jgi:serine/threonine protein kinase/WD40 repeat protein